MNGFMDGNSREPELCISEMVENREGCGRRS